MATKPKKDRPSKEEADDDQEAAPARKAKTVRDHSGAGKDKPKSSKKKSGAQPRIQRKGDPTAGIWTPAMLAIPIGLIAVFAVVFVLLVKSQTNSAPPPPPKDDAPPPVLPRPVALDPPPANAAPTPEAPKPAPKPTPKPKPSEPAPPKEDDPDAERAMPPPLVPEDDAPPIEGDE